MSLFACPDEEGMVISACNRETTGYFRDTELLILTLAPKHRPSTECF